MTEPTETIEIENVVASSGIDQELDLEQVGDDLGERIQLRELSWPLYRHRT